MSTNNAVIETEEYTVGWVCALPLEMAAAKGMLDHIHPDLSHQDPDDHNSYILGEIRDHKIVVACLPAGIYGTSPAATVANNLLRTFKSIRFGLLVGIGGGAPSPPDHDIRLGDVVISQPSKTLGGIIQHDRGKILSQGGSERTGSLNAPPTLLLSALSRLQATHMTEDSKVPEFLARLVEKSPKRMKSKFIYQGAANDRLYQADYDHIDPESPRCEKCDEMKTVSRVDRHDNDPFFHYGIVASGNQVIKDGKTRKRLSREYGALCFEMEAAGLYDFPCLVIRGICDYADSHKNKVWQEYAAATAAAFAKELLHYVAPEQVLKEEKLLTELMSIVKESHETSKQNLAEHESIKSLIKSQPLDLLVAHKARYDSEDVKSSPKCEPGTRFRILKMIQQWATENPNQPLFWLIGPAGTGKSTIARSVVDIFNMDKYTIAGYFFKRGDQDRNDTSRMFSTIAMQIADSVLSFRESLRKSLEGLDKETVGQLNLEKQFQKLLWQPLEALRLDDEGHLRIIIIIDALDECERPEHLLRVLELFSSLCTIPTICLRVLITSRHAPSIVEAFEPHTRNNAVRILQLHRELSEETKLDIRNFLEARFEDIRSKRSVQKQPWPTAEELNHLVQLSTTPEPLFIYAATLCRFVSDEQRGPIRQLAIWLEQGGKSQLQQIYSPILDQAFSGFDQEDDFIITDSDSNKYRIGAAEMHASLVERCIQQMKAGLKRDICNIQKLGTARDSIDTNRISRSIPTELQYACVYWFYHLKCSKRSLKDLTYQFLFDHFLHWIEVLALIGQLTEGAIIIRKLFEMSQSLDVIDKDFLYFMKDAIRVISFFGSIIEQYPLQIYGSLLFFSPVASKVRQLFWHQRIPTSGKIQGIERDWDARIQSFENMLGPVEHLAFSPNGHLLAFALDDRSFDKRTIELRNIVTGTTVHSFESSEKSIKAIAFSTDRHVFASAYDNGNIRILTMKTGQVELISPDEGFESQAISFFPDSHLIVSLSSEGQIRCWEKRGGIYQGKSGLFQALGDVFTPELRVLRATFSPLMKLLAFQPSLFKIEVYDLMTGVKVFMIDQDSPPNRFAFSADSRLLAVVYHRVLIIWNVEKGSEELSIRPRHRFNAVAFSPDSRLLASAGDGMIELWDLETGVCKATLPDGFGVISHKCTLAFSPDSQLLATPEQVWDVTLPQKTDPSDRHYARINATAWSPGGQLMASASWDKTIQIWDALTGIRQRVLEGHTASVDALLFSSDGQLLASASQDKTVRIWSMSSGVLQKTISDDWGCIAFVAYSADRQVAASISWSTGEEIKLWEVVTRTHLHTLKIPREFMEHVERWNVLLSLTFSPNGCIIAASTIKYSLMCWDTATGKLLREINPNSTFHRISRVVFSPDSRLIALRCGDSISLWRVDEPSRLLSFDTKPCQLVFSSDSKLLISAAEKVNVWDVTNGFAKLTFEGQKSCPEAIAISPNGQMMAIASWSHSVKVWNIGSDPKLHLILSHDKTIQALIFSPDAAILAVASHNLISLWNTSSGSQIRTISHPSGCFRNIDFATDEIVVTVSDYVSPRFFNVWDDMTLRLHTYHIPNTPPDELFDQTLNAELAVSRNWITYGSEKILWIPPQYSEIEIVESFPRTWISDGTVLFLTSNLGSVIWFQIT
ncbi:hypothetical protein ACHAQK_012028 [Fusarium lateritium]